MPPFAVHFVFVINFCGNWNSPFPSFDSNALPRGDDLPLDQDGSFPASHMPTNLFMTSSLRCRGIPNPLKRLLCSPRIYLIGAPALPFLSQFPFALIYVYFASSQGNYFVYVGFLREGAFGVPMYKGVFPTRRSGTSMNFNKCWISKRVVFTGWFSSDLMQVACNVELSPKHQL